MKFWVGVTDNSWFKFLSQENPDEVNFWQPNPQSLFKGFDVGSPFLFKLKKPYNHIAGGGYFVKYSTFPLSIVWETFGSKNGAISRQAFENLIRPLISDKTNSDPVIGCTVLTSPFFWPEARWIENPDGWANNIVRGRYYETQTPDGLSLWERFQQSLHFSPGVAETKSRYGQPALVAPRLGQGAFRVVVTDAYQRKCAITGENTLPVLEAAHILPFAEKGPNEISNGLLLRSDFHKLFDLGLITLTPDLTIAVSKKIRESWFNGKVYYRLDGQKAANLPADPSHLPKAEYLRWHNEHRFQG